MPDHARPGPIHRRAILGREAVLVGLGFDKQTFERVVDFLASHDGHGHAVGGSIPLGSTIPVRMSEMRDVIRAW